MEKFNQANELQQRRMVKLIEKMSENPSAAEFQKINEEIDQISLYCTLEEREKIRELCKILNIPCPRLRIIP